jgi:dephospho-CoA kinase
MGTATRMLVVGLVGGIGAGKSAVAGAFVRAGARVSDSDATARRLLQEARVRDELVRWWGAGVLDAQGQVDRWQVARIVFADASQRVRLEGLMHPLIHEQRALEMRQAQQAGARVFVIDAPLLLEAGLDKACDRVVFVDAPAPVRERRVRAGRGWTCEELHRRERAQLSLEEKRRRATDSVLNDEGAPELDAQVAGLLAHWRAAGLLAEA